MQNARLLALEHCRGRFELSELGDTVEYRCRKPLLATHAHTAHVRQRQARPW
jgi:hypothetical protein